MESAARRLPEPEPDPQGSDAGGEAGRMMRLVARREHELNALSELIQELTVTLDRFGAADLVLFNLMGQAGTARAALWLVADGEAPELVLLRSHGLSRSVATALGNAIRGDLLERMGRERRVMFSAEIEPMIPAGALLLRNEPVALLAPVCSRGELRGIVALGPRLDGQEYGAIERQVLETSLGMVGVSFENISLFNRLRENNRQLRVANDELRELDELKTSFLSNVNHELRTPLSVVIAYLQHLAESPSMEARQREFLEICLAQSLKLKSLLETLLDFSAMTADRLKMKIGSGSVADALAPYVEQRRPGVTEGLRELVLSTASDVPAASFDPQRLIEIVDVLVDNAVKFTPRGTHIEIRVRHQPEEDREWVAVEVRDDGPGIAADRLPNLFQVFRQGDGSLTRRVGGLGLGLSFARELAERMDGRLDVESRVGSGSTFRLLLPADA